MGRCRKGLTAFPVLLAVLLAGSASAEECRRLDDLESFVGEGRAPDGASCSTFQNTTGATGISCFWTFGFRDAAATDFAATLWSELWACRPGSAGGAELPVNHPDSYALLEWHAGGEVYRVSVKDKGDEGRTLVFLRFR